MKPGTESDEALRGRQLELGLVADPGITYDMARQLSSELPGLLFHQVSGHINWRVKAICRRLPADEQGEILLSALAQHERSEGGYDIVVCLTDQPRRAGLRPVVADASMERGVALTSLPALGPVRQYSRARSVIVRLVAELLGDGPSSERDAESRRDEALGGDFVASLERVKPADDEIGVRFLGRGGRVPARLLAGMVHLNRPWRLVPQLSGAFAGALAIGAYVLVNQSIWGLADTLSPLRLTVTSVFAVSAMVAWLIIDHHLWERPSGSAAQEKSALYNAATALTLFLGVLSMYLGLLALILIAGAVVIDSGLVQRVLGHPIGWKEYAEIAWLGASMAIVGGAIGSGLESDEAAHQAAYGYRQRERQRARAGSSERRS